VGPSTRLYDVEGDESVTLIGTRIPTLHLPPSRLITRNVP
jgi:hypothetical protein